MPQFVDGKILFVDGKIAFHEDCCCGGICDCTSALGSCVYVGPITGETCDDDCMDAAGFYTFDGYTAPNESGTCEWKWTKGDWTITVWGNWLGPGSGSYISLWNSVTFEGFDATLGYTYCDNGNFTSDKTWDMTCNGNIHNVHIEIGSVANGDNCPTSLCPCTNCDGAQPALVITEDSGCWEGCTAGGTYPWKEFISATCEWVFHRYEGEQELLITLPGSGLPSSIKCVDGILTGSVTGPLSECGATCIVTYTFGG